MHLVEVIIKTLRDSPNWSGCDYAELYQAAVAAGYGDRSRTVFESFLNVEADRGTWVKTRGIDGRALYRLP